MIVSIDAHHRCHAPDVASASEVAEIGSVHRSVLTLQPYAVEAGGAKGINVVRVGKAAGHVGDATLGEFVLDSVRSDLHIVFSWPLIVCHGLNEMN